MKKGWMRARLAGVFEQFAPYTYADQVYMDTGNAKTVKDTLGGLAAGAGGHPLILGTQTASTNVFTGSAPTIDSLYDGLQIMYYLPFAGTSTAATLNLTLKDGSSTGAVPCYYSGSTAMTTHIPAYGICTLIYRTSNGTVSTPGWWLQSTYNADTYDRVYYSNAIQAAEAVYRYKWVCQDIAGKWYPFFPDNKTSTTAAATWSISQAEFRIGSPILYYNTTTTVNAGATVSNLYATIPHEVRYNINAASLPNYAPVLLKGTLGPGGGFVLDSADYYATAFPTVDDGRLYLYLGYMYSTTAMRLTIEHPVYFYQNGRLRCYTGSAYVASNTTYTLAVANWKQNTTLGRYEYVISRGDITANSLVDVSVLGNNAGKVPLDAGIVDAGKITLISIAKPTVAYDVAVIVWGGIA